MYPRELDEKHQEYVRDLELKNDALNKRIAELEGLIDQLIEIGKGLDDGYEHYRFSEQTIPLIKLRKLTADWKEREE